MVFESWITACSWIAWCLLFILRKSLQFSNMGGSGAEVTAPGGAERSAGTKTVEDVPGCLVLLVGSALKADRHPTIETGEMTFEVVTQLNEDASNRHRFVVDYGVSVPVLALFPVVLDELVEGVVDIEHWIIGHFTTTLAPAAPRQVEVFNRYGEQRMLGHF